MNKEDTDAGFPWGPNPLPARFRGGSWREPWGPRCLCHCPCLSSPWCPQGLPLDLSSVYCSGISVLLVCGVAAAALGLLGVGFLKHGDVYIHPWLCSIFWKRIKTKVTAMINVHTLGSYQTFR